MEENICQPYTYKGFVSRVLVVVTDTAKLGINLSRRFFKGDMKMIKKYMKGQTMLKGN